VSFKMNFGIQAILVNTNEIPINENLCEIRV
jgi:hypothetical protein